MRVPYDRIDSQDRHWIRACEPGVQRPRPDHEFRSGGSVRQGRGGSGDIDKPSAVTERARSIGDRAASEIDAPGPRLTPPCGGRTRRPRTEEWPLPDDHPRRVCQLGALDPRSPITEEGLVTGPLPPPPSLGSCRIPGYFPENPGIPGLQRRGRPPETVSARPLRRHRRAGLRLVILRFGFPVNRVIYRESGCFLVLGTEMHP
jgi:hypothetical protein